MMKEMEGLGKARIDVFLDEKNIEAGRPIANEVREAIERCDEGVVLLSPNSKGREWVLMEMGGAWMLEKSQSCWCYMTSARRKCPISRAKIRRST
jgi:hypothetical protein